MAKSKKTGSAITEPKGRPTASRGGIRQRSILSPRLEWVLAVVVFLLVLAAIFYFFRDVRSTVDGAAASVLAGFPVSDAYVDAG